MKRTHNRSWFSIVLAIGLVLLLSLTGLYLIEYTIPFSRSIKGIENASQAFYEWYTGIEESVFEIYDGPIGEQHTRNFSDVQDYSYTTRATWNQTPVSGEWNSEYDIDWNTISQDNPISLLVWENRFWGGSNRIDVEIRVPNFDGDAWPDALSSYDDLILWQLSSRDDSLSGKDLISLSSASRSISVNLFTQQGLESGDATDAPWTPFSNFYSRECGAWNECVLRISIINPLIASWDNTFLPYLEYQLASSDDIPLAFAEIEVSWKSYGFTKRLLLDIPQRSTNAAFDFTVLQ